MFYDIFPKWAGVSTLLKQVAGRSKAQMPHCSLDSLYSVFKVISVYQKSNNRSNQSHWDI